MNINVNQFHNNYTLNIFTDASMNNKNNTGCYGAIAIVGDEIIDQTYRLVSNTTNNNSEIKGIRAGLGLALKYLYNFNQINLFSDSLISINGLRSYIHNWKIKDGVLYGSAGKMISNQSIFIECNSLLNYMTSISSTSINLYHQSGHVNNSYNDLVKASNSFKNNNNIYGKIDLNFIRYISTWNNYVDNTSRGMLRRNISNNNIYIDPVSFFVKDDWDSNTYKI